MMTGQTKMIIITSNEDIIRQFSLNKTTNTHIIDLENDKQGTSIAKDDNNIVDLAFLAKLSELDSNNDHVYKRVLDSPHHNRSKPAKIPKKSVDLICTICGDRAIGFNYDALSCASCKAFFRRNANQPSEKLRCFTGQGQCSVAHEMRRKCPRCRLDRCFAMGMRKDFIVSEEEKQKRRKNLEENRNISSKRSSTSESTNSSSISNPLSNSEPVSQILDEIDHLLNDMEKNDNNIVLHENTNSNQIEDTLVETLAVEDWVTIQSVELSFLSAFQAPLPAHCAHMDPSDRVSALITWSEYANEIVLRSINFFRQIDEFEGLHPDDRFILIKYNLLPLFPISKCFYYNPANNYYACNTNRETDKHCSAFVSRGESSNIYSTFRTLVLSLVEITEQDSTLLSLILTVLIFSQGLSMNENEPSLQNSLAVNRAQSYYTKLLWNYLVNKRGELQASRLFTQLLTIIFRMQSAAKMFREFFHVQDLTSDTVDRIAPLIQTVLHIS